MPRLRHEPNPWAMVAMLGLGLFLGTIVGIYLGSGPARPHVERVGGIVKTARQRLQPEEKSEPNAEPRPAAARSRDVVKPAPIHSAD